MSWYRITDKNNKRGAKIFIDNLRYFLVFVIGTVMTETSLGQEDFILQQNRYPRVRLAQEHVQQKVDSLFKNIDVIYPPDEILIVAFKDEQILEVWVRPKDVKTFTLVTRYRFTSFSGTLGPKRRQGDLQIPEGFYQITDFNPVSNFHLSLKIDYPNASDKILAAGDNWGGEIYIHGNEVTIGCIPVGDQAIEELYIVCIDALSCGHQNIPVYIFPARMDSLGMIKLLTFAQADTTLLNFWKNLKQGYDIFDMSHQKLKFKVGERGNYIFSNQTLPGNTKYRWLPLYRTENSLANRIKVPDGYVRLTTTIGSFADWLRNLPLKEGTPSLHLYDGRKKVYQGGHYAIVDIDVGNNDLQQCADAVIRLYAEFLYAEKEFDDIKFRLTNGDIIKFRKWLAGYRPRVLDNRIGWEHTMTPDSSYNIFRGYLNFIFMYAGTYSLNQQLQRVIDIKKMEIGDIFIQGGFPGHAVLVVDMAVNTVTGERIFLLCQSYMPAQDIHILKNLNEPNLGPWYRLNFGETLSTPEWNFSSTYLKKF